MTKPNCGGVWDVSRFDAARQPPNVRLREETARRRAAELARNNIAIVCAALLASFPDEKRAALEAAGIERAGAMTLLELGGLLERIRPALER
jgi:hypothetical protein